MATIEERVAFLEGRVGEYGQMINGIRDALVSLEARMDRRFEAMDRRFDAIDRRFESIEGRLGHIEARVAGQFLWIVGIQVTTLVAIVAAVLAR